MALVESTLVVALFGATQRLLQRCHTLFGSGAKGRSAHYFFGTRDSCTRHAFYCVGICAHLLPPYSGAIGAWIKNIDGDRESETGDT